jgi:hypothetical protein
MSENQQHYMGNPLLKRANIPSEFTQEQLVELAKCASDPVYFAKNYIKIVNIDDGLVPFNMWPFQEKMLRTFHENRFSICKLPRQPLEDNTLIPTPSGYTKIKDLKINDVVYDLYGKQTKIINKVSYKNTEKCYKLSFKGKSFEEEIVCDKDHFWRVYFDDTSVVLTAEQIYYLKREVFLKRQSFNTLVDNWDEVIQLTSIEEVEPVNVSCVEVENKDHSFLCGKNFIPTMNCGKALALDTKIPTPTGWTTMGELKVGDEVLSPSGDSVKVLTKTDPMYNHKCYKIYFDNGEEIVADADHLWEVCKNKYNSKKEILTTERLVEKYKNKTSKSIVNSYYINVSNSVNCFTKKELPIDPYLLGVWLGDGYSAGGRIIAHKDDFEFYKTKIDNIGHIADSNNCYRFNVIDLHSKLRKINLIKNKHIPQDYLRSTYEDRLELLRGLMDTDGSLRPNSRSFEFYQKNYDLILQVIELLASLGIKSRTRIKKIKDCLYYTVSFNTDEIVFNLPRKKNLIKKIDKPLYRNKRIYIQKIEEVESVPVACISVDSEDKLFLCGNSFIPTHNSTTAVSFLLHYSIFNDNVSIAILANKASTAKDLLGRLQISFENLPNWMQQGIKSWNKTSLELENGSKIITASTSASSVRGGSYNVIFLDEFAFVPNNVALNFMNSVYPTISSGKDSKVIVVSTPNSLNHFYKMWDEAIKKENDYIPLEINWNDVPGRDEEWRKKTIANLGSQKAFDQEFNCSFLGSSNTLISGAKLQTMVHHKPIKSKKFLDTHEEPIEEHQYMITVDVARGVDLDYSAFTVIDITKMPYKVVAKYRDNTIKPIMFPYIVKDVGLHYNKAFVLCETNDVGDQVANALHYDLEYPNLLTCFIKGRQGQVLGQGFGGNRVEYGVKMSKNVKKLGSINLKMLIEEDKLLINDYDTINELSTFIQKSNSFMAEEGKNDDLVSCLILFAWASTNEYFKEITDDDIRKRLFQEKQADEENDMLPIGFLENGLQEETFVEKDTLWQVVPDEELMALWNFY